MNWIAHGVYVGIVFCPVYNWLQRRYRASA